MDNETTLGIHDFHYYLYRMKSEELIEFAFSVQHTKRMEREDFSLSHSVVPIEEGAPTTSGDQPAATPAIQPQATELSLSKERPTEPGPVGIDPKATQRNVLEIVDDLIKANGVDVATVDQIIQSTCVHPATYNLYCQVTKAQSYSAMELAERMLPILQHVVLDNRESK